MGDWLVFAIKTDGTLWAWGRQADVYTGATNPASNPTPTQVGTNSDWQACCIFSQWCPLFLKRDGSLWALDASDHIYVKPASTYQPVRLRRITLPKNIVSFAGGRHGCGVALMADGEVWNWGESLGGQTRGIPPLQFVSRLFNRIRLPIRLGEPQSVTHEEPSPLRNLNPDSDSTQ
jgi:alpha-tubulin suppressor-like RCC1 family protein